MFLGVPLTLRQEHKDVLEHCEGLLRADRWEIWRNRGMEKTIEFARWCIVFAIYLELYTVLQIMHSSLFIVAPALLTPNTVFKCMVSNSWAVFFLVMNSKFYLDF